MKKPLENLNNNEFKVMEADSKLENYQKKNLNGVKLIFFVFY